MTTTTTFLHSMVHAVSVVPHSERKSDPAPEIAPFFEYNIVKIATHPFVCMLLVISIYLWIKIENDV